MHFAHMRLQVSYDSIKVQLGEPPGILQPYHFHYDKYGEIMVFKVWIMKLKMIEFGSSITIQP